MDLQRSPTMRQTIRSPRFFSIFTLLATGGLASLLILATGCQTLRNLNIRNPEYRIRSVVPRVDLAFPLTASRINLEFAIDVENPNSVRLLMDGLDFNVLLNGTRVVNGFSSQRVQIPANGTGHLALRTEIGYSDIRNLWTEVVDMIQGERASYEIQGTAHYDTPVGRLSFPLTVYRASR